MTDQTHAVILFNGTQDDVEAAGLAKHLVYKYGWKNGWKTTLYNNGAPQELGKGLHIAAGMFLMVEKYPGCVYFQSDAASEHNIGAVNLSGIKTDVTESFVGKLGADHWHPIAFTLSPRGRTLFLTRLFTGGYACPAFDSVMREEGWD